MHLFEDKLKEIGLLPSEAKVYLSSLTLGPSSVQNIAKKSGLSRTAAYEAVELLQKRGLMSKTSSGKSSLFAAEDPDKILSFLASEQHRFQTLMGDFTRSIDALRLLSGGARPIVRIHEGEEVLRTFFQHIFAEVKPKNYSEFCNLDDVYAAFDVKDVQAMRKAHPHSPENFRILYTGEKRLPRPGVKLKRLSEKWGTFHGAMTIYDNNVAFITYSGKPVIAIVESAALAQTMQTLFDLAWEHSEEPEENVT